MSIETRKELTSEVELMLEQFVKTPRGIALLGIDPVIERPAPFCIRIFAHDQGKPIVYEIVIKEAL